MKTDDGKKIVLTLYIFWIAQVVIQNVFRITGSDTAISVLLKVFLLAFLFVRLLRSQIDSSRKAMTRWVLFAVYIAASFFLNDSDISLTNIVFYFFPVLLAFLVYIENAGSIISEKNYMLFLKLIVGAVLVFSLYSIFFQFDSFRRLLTLKTAYSNELTSIFSSNLEYGMYLTFGIASILVMHQKKHVSTGLAVVLLAIFGLNLLATFSRTSIAATAIIVIVFLVASPKSSLKSFFIVFGIIAAILILTSGILQDFFNLIVFKGGTDSGRFAIWEYFIDLFKNSSSRVKFFGMGNTNYRYLVETLFRHGSAHNAFLQILMVFGLSGLILLVAYIINNIGFFAKLKWYDRWYSAFFVSLALSSIMFMFTATSCLMASSIDSFMLTMYTMIVPRMVSNQFLVKQNTLSAQDIRNDERAHTV